MASASSFALNAQHVSVQRGDREVLFDISLLLTEHSRIAVVGPNGVGKSTLLGVLAGQVEIDGGSVTRSPRSATVGLLRQELETLPQETGRDYVSRLLGITSAQREFTAATDSLAAGNHGSDDRYNDALERWLALGAADIDARMSEVADDLGLADAVLDQHTSTLSGGQAARLGLAVVLLSRFDITLLDEPTNNLDTAGLRRLEDWVEHHDRGVALVSHDRTFLQRVAKSVFELDEHSHTGRLFNGGWDAFLSERAIARGHAETAHANYVNERDRLSQREQTQREWATQGLARAKKSPSDPDKFVRNFKVDQTEKLAGKAASTAKAIERLEVVDKPWEGWNLQFSVTSAPRSSTVVANLSHAVVRRGSFELGPIDLDVRWADRVAILGPNGSGKTTLISALLGRTPLVSGSAHLGTGVHIGEIDQARMLFERADDTSLLYLFEAHTKLITSEARSVLAKFGLDAEAVSRPARTLSPGERTRSQLALFQAIGVNLLVLDEPTNHLDIEAIEQLESALDGYDGTLILVSHDRTFLESVKVDRTVDLTD